MCRHGGVCDMFCAAHSRRRLALPHTSAPFPLSRLAGTEIAGSFLTGSPLQPQAPSTFSTPAIGHCPVIITQRAGGGLALSVHGDNAGAVLSTVSGCGGVLRLAIPDRHGLDISDANPYTHHCNVAVQHPLSPC